MVCREREKMGPPLPTIGPHCARLAPIAHDWPPLPTIGPHCPRLAPHLTARIEPPSERIKEDRQGSNRRSRTAIRASW